MVRLFTALEIPDDIAEALKRRQSGLPGARWRGRDSLHITLCFHGEVREERAHDLAAELSRIDSKPFEINLSGVGAFCDDYRSRTIWAGVEASEPLSVLAGRCARASERAGVPVEKRTYRPHLTLASLKVQIDPGRIAAWITGHNLLKSPPIRIDRFGLYSSTLGSEGSTYELEREYLF